MTRTTLRYLTLMIAGASAPAFSAWTGLPVWTGLPLVPLVWFLLSSGGRALQGFVVTRRVERDRRLRRATGAVRAAEAAQRLRRIAVGEAGFTRTSCPLPALERAVLFPASPGEEALVLTDIGLMMKQEERDVAEGFIALTDEVTTALTAPFHPLYLDADSLMPLLGFRLPRILGTIRAAQTWAKIRHELAGPLFRETIAVRLLQARMPTAALRVLQYGPRTKRRRTLRRLARLLVVLHQGEREGIGFRADVWGPWAAPVTLVAGRRLKDLLPGSLFVEAAPKGAESLDLAVRRVPRLVTELTALQVALPNLRDAVRDAVAAVLARDPVSVAKELARGEVEARADRALACHLRGLAVLAERRPREAIAEFDAALRGADDFAPAAYSLAVAHYRAGEKETAGKVIRAYAASHPADPDAAALLARFLGESGDRYGARRAWRDAVRRFPDVLSVRMAFAQVLQSWGDGKGAAEQFDFARRALPADPRLAFLAGRARVSAGRGADAVEALEQAAQSLRGAERAEAMFWLVSALRGEGRHDRAVVIAGELVDGLGREQVEMLDDVAEYLEERHDYAKARRAANRARRLRGGEW